MSTVSDTPSPAPDALRQFVDDWLTETPIKPPPGAYAAVAGNVGLTLYRDARFQVQLWTFPPNSRVSDHAHPGVDTWLVRVNGKFRLRKNGAYLSPADAERTTWRGMRTWMTRIGPDDVHGVEIGEAGGSFLSITERIDGAEPVSVHMAWEGAPLSEDHAVQLGAVSWA